MSNPRTSFATLVALLAVTLAGCEQPVEKSRNDTVGMSQVPQPVQAAIESEAKSGTLKQIEMKIMKGKTAYQASVMVNGEEQKTLIADDGKVISRKVSDMEERH